MSRRGGRGFTAVGGRDVPMGPRPPQLLSEILIYGNHAAASQGGPAAPGSPEGSKYALSSRPLKREIPSGPKFQRSVGPPQLRPLPWAVSSHLREPLGTPLKGLRPVPWPHVHTWAVSDLDLL